MSSLYAYGLFLFNLETPVGYEKYVQDIAVHRKFSKFVLTLLVMRTFQNFPGAARACAEFRTPTEVSRFEYSAIKYR